MDEINRTNRGSYEELSQNISRIEDALRCVDTDYFASNEELEKKLNEIKSTLYLINLVNQKNKYRRAA